MGKKKTGKGKKGFFRSVPGWLLLIILMAVSLSMFQVVIAKFMNPPVAWSAFLEGVYQLWTVQSDVKESSWRGLDEISPHMRRAVLAGEDQRFLLHHGFDLTEMGQAIRGLVSGKGVRGASTITMQVARTVFLWPQRTWTRKALEAYYTLLIELFWSKKRILEVYLNTVDWGSRITGIEEASSKYFHVSPMDISRSQAALLAAILPSPHRWSPTKPGPQVLRRQKRILRDMAGMPLV